jgi:hypothetical protein
MGLRKTPCSWIEPRTTWQWGLDDLVDGLCSYYFRNGDRPVPDRLTEDRLIDIVKAEYEAHGTENVWTWSDEGRSYAEAEECRGLARGLVREAFPGLTYGSTR